MHRQEESCGGRMSYCHVDMFVDVRATPANSCEYSRVLCISQTLRTQADLLDVHF